MWNYAEFPDGTCIAYSNLQDNGTIKIVIERARDGGFDTAHCLMPAYHWTGVDGFTDDELSDLKEFLRDNAPLIFELAEAPYDERLTA